MNEIETKLASLESRVKSLEDAMDQQVLAYGQLLQDYERLRDRLEAPATPTTTGTSSAKAGPAGRH